MCTEGPATFHVHMDGRIVEIFNKDGRGEHSILDQPLYCQAPGGPESGGKLDGAGHFEFSGYTGNHGLRYL